MTNHLENTVKIITETFLELMFQFLLGLKDLVKNSRLISPAVRGEIADLIDSLTNLGELEAQARYDSLFERGRTLSLWLFERPSVGLLMTTCGVRHV